MTWCFIVDQADPVTKKLSATNPQHFFRSARQMLTDPDSVLGENAKDAKSEKVDA